MLRPCRNPGLANGAIGIEVVHSKGGVATHDLDSHPQRQVHLIDRRERQQRRKVDETNREFRMRELALSPCEGVDLGDRLIRNESSQQFVPAMRGRLTPSAIPSAFQPAAGLAVPGAQGACRANHTTPRKDTAPERIP